MINRITFLVTLFILLAHKSFCLQGVVIVPVADLIGDSCDERSSSSCYAHFPHAYCLGSQSSCSRLHQLLFNETVEVLQIKKDELLVKITNAYYIEPSKKTWHSTYWIQKKAVMLLDTVSSEEKKRIPLSLNFATHQFHYDSRVVSLLEPWYDKKTGYIFSAGTRFLRCDDCFASNQQSIPVWRIDPSLGHSLPMYIDTSVCFLTDNRKSNADRVADFITIIRTWISNDKGIVPYVLGGVSFTYRLHDDIYSIVPMHHSPSTLGYIRTSDIHTTKCGLDCSGLVLRGAQLAGIPYFAKNTTTIADRLKPLLPGQSVCEGDLILINGHVLIISDLKNNLIIEARSYQHGYGKVHEIPVEHVFKNMVTIQDLVKVHLQKSPIDRIDVHGTVRDHFPFLTIMRMASVWE